MAGRAEMFADQPHLAPRRANHRPLSPIEHLGRMLETRADAPAVVWRDQRWSYRGFGAMVARLAAHLRAAGIGRGDVVSVLLNNRPEMLAAHYAVPMLGAILNSLNTRLDPAVIAHILGHSGSRILLAEPETLATAETAARMMAAGDPVPVILLADPEPGAHSDSAGAGIWRITGSDEDPGLPEDLLAEVADEWQPICLNYTSGTTGQPKGAVYHHRGAALNTFGNVLTMGFDQATAYLWTLPMFHCNGWCHSWAVTAAGGVHICLDRPEPGAIFAAIRGHGVTHMACAPVVLYMLLNHPDRSLREGAAGRVTVGSGGAAPSVALISGMDALGFDFYHLYGLTESFGPASACIAGPSLAPEARATRLARQGARHPTASLISVLDAQGNPVPEDGATTGEITLRGNTLMAGYWRDAEATEQAFAGGAFRTGDLAVRHPGGDIEIRDRAKDIIISGGENISSLEIENALHLHPAVLLAAIVAAPDPKWGEIPCAFIELKDGAEADAATLTAFARQHLAGYKVPRRFVFGPLPRTATGKIRKYVLREQVRQKAEKDAV